MGAAPSPWSPAETQAVRRIAIGASLATIGTLGAVWPSLLGPDFPPLQMTLAQAALALVAAGLGAAAFLLPRGRRARWVFGLAPVIGFAVWAVSMVAVKPDRYGIYYVIAILLGISSAVASVVLMFSTPAIRNALEQYAASRLDGKLAALVRGSTVVASTWACVLAIAFARGSATAFPALVTAGGLGAFAFGVAHRGLRQRWIGEVARGGVPGYSLTPLGNEPPPIYGLPPRLPSLGVTRQFDAILLQSPPAGLSFRDHAGPREVARVSGRANPASLFAVSAVAIAVILGMGGAAIWQTERGVRQAAFEARPACYEGRGGVDADGHTELEHAARALVPSVNQAFLAIEQPSGGPRGHLWIVTEDETPLGEADLAKLSRGLADSCRWGDDAEHPPPFVVDNAQVRTLNLAFAFRATRDSAPDPSPEVVAAFEEHVRANVRQSFERGPHDGRRLSPDCWDASIGNIPEAMSVPPVDDAAPEIHVLNYPVSTLRNGSNVCWEGAPAWPRLGEVTVVLKPAETVDSGP